MLVDDPLHLSCLEPGQTEVGGNFLFSERFQQAPVHRRRSKRRFQPFRKRSPKLLSQQRHNLLQLVHSGTSVSKSKKNAFFRF
jgi:hypothetical protein